MLLKARVEAATGRQEREHTAGGKGRRGKWEGKKGNREVGRETGKSCNASQGSCRDASGLIAAGTYSWGGREEEGSGKWEGKRGNREVGRETGKSCNASQGSCRGSNGSTAAGTCSWGGREEEGSGKGRGETGRWEGKQGRNADRKTRRGRGNDHDIHSPTRVHIASLHNRDFWTTAQSDVIKNWHKI